jgi:O-antigen/teichoic acid export membrane protein
LIRKKQFKIIARVTVSQSFILNFTKVAVGLIYPFGQVLVVLSCIGSFLFASQLWFASQKWSGVKNKINKPLNKITELKYTAYKYRDFPAYRAPQQFSYALSESLPALMLASFIGVKAVGFYTLAKAIMAVPTTLIGKAVGDVFYPRITEAGHNKENLFKLVLRATLALAAVGILPFSLVIAFGPWLFIFFFGPEWGGAGEYARWLSFWLFFGFINKPSISALVVLGLQKFLLKYEFISIALRVLALYVGFVVFISDQIAVAIFSLVGAVLNIYLILSTLSKSKKFNYD